VSYKPPPEAFGPPPPTKENYHQMLERLRQAAGAFFPEDKKMDMVNHPPHYTTGRIEVIDYIEDKKLCYHLGNVVKYVSRAGKKDDSLRGTVQDLKKARWYLDRYITELELQENERASAKPA
jgi:hypothetical protein